MKILQLAILLSLWGINLSIGQTRLSDVKTKTYKTTSNLKIEGTKGYLVVPENRNNPASRQVKMKFIHLKSLSQNPAAPLIYLEGGGGQSTWQAERAKDLTDWIQVLEVSDLIFVDRKGSDDKLLTYIWKGGYPSEFLLSEESANQHYQKMAEKALPYFEEKGVDLAGYTIVEHAKDVDELATALGIKKYSIFGFSFGSSIGMTAMKLFPDRIERAILAGADAPGQSFNYPNYLERHIEKIQDLLSRDPQLSQDIPDLRVLVNRVMNKLKENPATVTVKNPLTRKNIDIDIGPFGLALVLRLDIDDWHDIPAIPRLLYTIDQGDYSMLRWFVQKRLVFGLALPGNGINQGVASGASPARWSTILEEANESIFGNVVNFPFSAVKEAWPTTKLEIDTSLPIESDIPTLFITGTLDCRTPVEQVNLIMESFSNAAHIEVEMAGHEQAMWDKETCDETIPDFLRGKSINSHKAFYADLDFLPLEGPAEGHGSVK